jgi:two-component system, LytTR family, sensor kinase
MRSYICPDCNAIDLREEINIMGNNGINIASFLALLALGIKFTKNWYQQQIQNRILARQKITSELRLLKARIQPGFLFETLQVLYYKIAADKNMAAEILLKFSELLSYMLYECNDEFVLVQRELFIMHEFIELEKMMKEPKLKITHNVTKQANTKYIPSFILLSLVQNCVIALHDNTHQELHHIDVNIHAKDNRLYCLMVIQPAEAGAIRDTYAGIIHTFINRLESVYTNNYKLQLSEEAGKFIITMSLLLLDNFPSNTMEEIAETPYAYARI